MKAPRKLIVFTLFLILSSVCAANQNVQVSNAKSGNGLSYDLMGDGPLLVLIHGSNLDRRMWENEVGYLQKDHKVLSYDQRGLGTSDTPSVEFSNHDDLINLINELGESEATLIGLSSGAQIAIDVALATPGMVKRMVLVSPSLNGVAPKQNPPYLSDLISALRSNDYSLANEILLGSPVMRVPEQRAKLVRSMVEESRQWVLPYSLMKREEKPLIENLDTISVPTLILVGENDLDAVRDQGKLLENGLQDAKLIAIEEGGHLLNMTSPDPFREVLSDFVEESLP